MCGSIKMLKRNVWTTLPLAYHGCKNLTHTSKTRQVKRTQMAGRFTVRTFFLSQTAKNRTLVAMKWSHASI